MNKLKKIFKKLLISTFKSTFKRNSSLYLKICVETHFLRVKHTVDKPSHKMHLKHSSISSFCFQKLQCTDMF